MKYSDRYTLDISHGNMVTITDEHTHQIYSYGAWSGSIDRFYFTTYMYPLKSPHKLDINYIINQLASEYIEAHPELLL